MSKNSRRVTRNPSSLGFTHLILIIGIVLIGIVGIGYFVIKNGQIKVNNNNPAVSSPTPTPQIDGIEGWKTYRNEEYGFEFQHPSSWIYNLEEAGERSYNYLGIVRVTSGETLSETWKIISPNCGKTYEKTIIANTNAEKVIEYCFISSPSSISYKIQTPKGSVGIIFRPKVTADESWIESHNQILSTFRFID